MRLSLDFLLILPVLVGHRRIPLKVRNIKLIFYVRFISALKGQNLMSKSKWWVLIIVWKWVPNVKFNFDVCVESRHCLTDTSKSNSTLGTFSGKCPEDFGNTVENKMSKFAQFFLQVPDLSVYREKMLLHVSRPICGRSLRLLAFKADSFVFFSSIWLKHLRN